MRILFFVHRYAPSVGGVEKYIAELGHALLQEGHQIDVVAGAHRDGLSDRESIKGITVHRFPAMRSPLRCRVWLWRRLSLFARADVINVSNTHMLEYLWRMLGPMLPYRKLFLIRHGMSCTYPVPDSEKERARRSAGLVQGVVHDGQFIGKWLGVEPDLCPDQGLRPMADELAVCDDPPPDSAIYVGRLEPDTSISKYVEAVRILNRKPSSPFRLDVYGDGSLLGPMKRRAEAERLPIRFHGKETDAQQHFSQAVFAFVDGRMAIQEAMARRCLVIASYGNPLKFDYIAGESFSPHLVLSADAEDIARKVVYYIDQAEQRKEHVSRAYRHACGLSWTRAAAEIVRFWGERLARPAIYLSPATRMATLWKEGPQARSCPSSSSAAADPVKWPTRRGSAAFSK